MLQDEVRAMVKSIERQIDVLVKAKAALEAVNGPPLAPPSVHDQVVTLAARGRGGYRAPTMTVPLRLGLIDVLKQAGHALTIPEIMPALERLGWRSESPNKRGMVSVELGKMARRKEIKRFGTTPRKYALGDVKPKAARPSKREPWQKKLATAKAMVSERSGPPFDAMMTG